MWLFSRIAENVPRKPDFKKEKAKIRATILKASSDSQYKEPFWHVMKMNVGEVKLVIVIHIVESTLPRTLKLVAHFGIFTQK